MVRIYSVAIAFLVCAFGYSAEAISQDQTRGINGHKLSRDCNAQDYAYGDGYCYGFVAGAWQAFTAISGQKWFCEPSNATTEKMVEVVVPYLADHPQRLGESALLLTLDAFGEAFPCSEYGRATVLGHSQE